MAKFCSQCGKPLAEGEVCSCQSGQAAQGQPQFDQTAQGQPQFNQTAQGQPQYQTNKSSFDFQRETKSLLNNILELIKNPVAKVKEGVKKNDFKFGLEMIVGNIAIQFIMLIIFCIVVRVKLGDMAKYVDIPYFKMIFFGTSFDACIYFALAGIIWGITKLVGKKDLTFAQSCVIVGSKAFFDIAVSVIVVVMSLIAPEIAVILFLVGCMFGLIVMVVSYCAAIDIEDSKKVYILWITFLCMMLVLYLIIRVMINNAMGSALSGLGSSSSLFN